jgi:ABC-type cobalamin/Fe3+-siderophores transport system ATPase subunit/phage tail protein X
MSTNLDRSNKVAEIIKSRREHLPKKIPLVYKSLDSRISLLRDLVSLWENLQKSFENIESIEGLGKSWVSSNELNEIYSKSKEQKAILDKLRNRFDRKTLNIGVVGLMGQGKSALLKTISGLVSDPNDSRTAIFDDIIPARIGGACTASRSVITNKSGDIEVSVVFHSEESFIKDVVHPYYDVLEGYLRFPCKPNTLNEFAEAKFPDLSLDPEKEAFYKRLRNDYHSNFSQYRSSIGSNELHLKGAEISQVRDYVMQERNSQNDLIIFKHLAVREVQVSCPFSNPDVGNIALVDTPGLGDSKLGDEKVLLETLGKDVDVVLFIKRPDPSRFQWESADELRLHKSANEALNNIENRAFMVLNHDAGINNLAACQSLQSTINHTVIKVVQTEIADCSDNRQVNEVFDIILDYLTEHITQLDEEYARICQEELIAINDQIDRILSCAKLALSRSRIDFENVLEEKYDELFGDDKQGWWYDIKAAFQSLRQILREQSNTEDEALKKSVEEAIQVCKADASILTLEKAKAVDLIKNRILGSDSMKVYSDYRNEFRTLLSDHFSYLDVGLKQSTENVKRQAASILTDKGKLGYISPNSSGTEFFLSFSQFLEEDKYTDLKRLHKGIKVLADFELSYRGLIEPQIYKHLAELSNIKSANEQEPEIFSPNPKSTPEQIFIALQIEYEKSVARIRSSLEEMLSQPSWSMYARVEQFIDNIIYHEEAFADWKKFLRRNRSQVWPDDIGKLKQNAQKRKDWDVAVNRLELTNQISTIQFLN